MKNPLEKIMDLENYETSTAYIIHKDNFTTETFLNLKSKMSTLDFKSEEIPKAIFEREGYVFIPKIDLHVVQYILNKPIVFTKEIPPHLFVDKPYKLKWDPLPHQKSIIEEGTRHLMKSDDKRLCICLAPGLGKTFCTSAILNKLQCKFIFLVYSAKIIEQSIKAMSNHFGGNQGFYVLSSSSDFLDLNYNKINGLFMTHAMFKSLIKVYGIETINEILFEKIGVNLKILDEFDREVGSMYYMDALMGFRYSIYLTGTKFKSLKPDDRLFQLIFRKVKTLGLDIRLEPNKDMLFVHYDFKPSPGEFYKINRDEATFKIYYNNYIAQKDVLLDFIMKKFYYDDEADEAKNSAKLFKKMLEEKGQIQFFCGRIENCSIVARKLEERFGIDYNDIGIYNSQCNARQKSIAINKPFLVTTSQSLGRGVDSDMVRVLVMLEFHFSLSELQQQMARVGRIGKKFGYVIYPVDHSFSKIMMSYNAKLKHGVFRDGVKNNFHFRVPDMFSDKYYYGYDPDSEKAEGIRKAKKKNQTRKVSKEIMNAFGIK